MGLGVVVAQSTSLLNCLKAKHDETLSVQMLAVAPSMLEALESCLENGRPSMKQLAGAPTWGSPSFQKQANPSFWPLLSVSCTQSRPGMHCASDTQGWHTSVFPALSVEQVLLMESQTSRSEPEKPQASALVPVHWTHAPAEHTFLPGM